MRHLSIALVAAVALAAPRAVADRRPSVLDSQPFAAGPLPGAPYVVIKTKGSNAHCGGVAVTAKVKKSKTVDKHLAAVFKLSFPSGLDFNPNNEAKRKKSLKKFDDWYAAANAAATDAAAHYRSVIDDAKVAPLDKVAAAAKLVLVARWTAHSVGRGSIPKDVVKVPEAKDIYCSTLLDKAEPIAVLASDAAMTCRDLATQGHLGAGWWDDVCIP